LGTLVTSEFYNTDANLQVSHHSKGQVPILVVVAIKHMKSKGWLEVTFACVCMCFCVPCVCTCLFMCCT